MTILQTLLKYVTRDEAHAMLNLIAKATKISTKNIARKTYKIGVTPLSKTRSLRLFPEEYSGLTLEVQRVRSNKRKKTFITTPTYRASTQ